MEDISDRKELKLHLHTIYPISTPSFHFHWIYLSLVISFTGGVALLPFLSVMVTVKCSGILRPETEISHLQAPSSGIVQEVIVKENDDVIKGQILFLVRSPLLDEKELFLIEKLKKTQCEISDLNHLSTQEAGDIAKTPVLITSLYRQSFADYRQKLIDRQFRLQKVTQDYERNRKLFDRQVLARAEFENYEFDLRKTKSDIDVAKQSQLSDWQKELTNHEREFANDLDQLAQVRLEKQNLNIIAPTTGSIQNMAGVYPGSRLLTGQEIAWITPKGYLIAEVYTSPADIGLLREGMNVNIRIMAFDYNQWGLVNGRVSEISKDVQFKNNEPWYEIKCVLTKDYVSLRNGYQRKLKTGMTLQASFAVVERTLWQLLYDKVDNWMNPYLQP